MVLFGITNLSIFLIWILNAAHICFGIGSPTNLNATIITKNCTVALNVSWTKPSTNIKINNFIIYYFLRNVSAAISTADNQTIYLLKNMEHSATYNISLSTNVTYQNGTYVEWPRSAFVQVTTGSSRLCTTPNTDKGSNSKSGDTMYVVEMVGIIVGGSVGMILVFFISFRCCAAFMERNYDKRDKAIQESKEREFGRLADTQVPITEENFFDHMSAMKFSDNRGFNNEFTKLNALRAIGCSLGSRPYNNMKNRFANVPTYDKTRVILKEEAAQPGSDYINANYIDGFEGPKSYIATQAPLPETLQDFWRMIWEKEINGIVMITHLHEKGTSTCAKYWPEESSIQYGNIIVKALDIDYYPDYVIRTFELKYQDSFELRLVRQFQYMSWPVSRSVPLHPHSFLQFVQKVNTFRVNNRQPLVVHCSSGCGRTGVFIVVDNQLERIKRQGDVNIFFNVNTSRDQRFQLVRNIDEYVFIHECVLEYVTFKNKIDLNIQNLMDYIVKNKEKDSKGKTGFQNEFEELSRSVTELKSTSEVGASSFNSRKNRFEKILPYDDTRVRLCVDATTTTSSQSPDYINASYIYSERRKRGFIVTQDPMEATLFDFWHMIWENASIAIAMLSSLDEDFVPYWPEKDQTMKAGKLNIRIISTESFKYFNIRHLEVSHTKVEGSRLIRQYQFKTWPESTNEESLTAFVDFIIQCKHWNSVSKSKMITVHCRAGTGKSGVFVAISNLIDRACSDIVFNVFNTVRKLRTQRTAMVQTQEQYEFIYHAIAHYYKYRYPRRNDKDAGTQTDEDSLIDESTSTFDAPANFASVSDYQDTNESNELKT